MIASIVAIAKIPAVAVVFGRGDFTTIKFGVATLFLHQEGAEDVVTIGHR